GLGQRRARRSIIEGADYQDDRWTLARLVEGNLGSISRKYCSHPTTSYSVLSDLSACLDGDGRKTDRFISRQRGAGPLEVSPVAPCDLEGQWEPERLE